MSTSVAKLLLIVLAGTGAVVAWVLLVSTDSKTEVNIAHNADKQDGILDGELPNENPAPVAEWQDDLAFKPAVRKYLQENLDDPDFEEVKWWTPSELKKSLRYSHPLSDYERDNVRLWFYEAAWKPFSEAGIAIRLKYRAKNLFGVKTMRDTVFLIDGLGDVFGVMNPEDLRDSRESKEDYAARMRSEPSTQLIIASALKVVENQEGVRGFLQDLKREDPKRGVRKPLDPNPFFKNP